MEAESELWKFFSKSMGTKINKYMVISYWNSFKLNMKVVS